MTELASDVLQDSRPFIWIVNQPETKGLQSKEGPDFNQDGLGDPVEMKTQTGWLLYYYAAKDKQPAKVMVAMGASPDSDAKLAEASLERQAFLTAVELVEIVINQGWDKFKLLSGSPDLACKVWGYLKYIDLNLSGYKPSAADKARMSGDNVAFCFDDALKALDLGAKEPKEKAEKSGSKSKG